jgi:hypothetical protein
MDTKLPTAGNPVSLRELLRQVPPPKWVAEMIEHHRRTGAYRPEDIERLLGDPNRRVEVRSEMSINSLLADLQSRST